MSKYRSLTDFLESCTGEITLSFAQIRQLVPDIAPSHGKDSRWWINNDPSHSHCRSWGDAGFTAHPDIARGRVTFRPTTAAYV